MIENCNHGHFTICSCCGKRGPYCFLDSLESPLGRKSEWALEELLTFIENHSGEVFTTTKIWRNTGISYGLTCRIMRWLQHLRLVERLPGPPQAGNRWQIPDGMQPRGSQIACDASEAS